MRFEKANFETRFSSLYRRKGFDTGRFQARWVSWIQLVRGPHHARGVRVQEVRAVPRHRRRRGLGVRAVQVDTI
jgi:hypothetical protein